MIDLWLDDERDPNDPRIQEQFDATDGMIWVKTAHAAIHRLKSGTVRFISLDHDLGTTATGYDVAKWIEERACRGDLPRLAWAVHSTNVEGAKNIRRVMLRADHFWLERDGKPDPFA